MAPTAQPTAAGTAAKIMEPTPAMSRRPKPAKATKIPASMNDSASMKQFRHDLAGEAMF